VKVPGVGECGTPVFCQLLAVIPALSEKNYDNWS